MKFFSVSVTARPDLLYFQPFPEGGKKIIDFDRAGLSEPDIPRKPLAALALSITHGSLRILTPSQLPETALSCSLNCGSALLLQPAGAAAMITSRFVTLTYIGTPKYCSKFSERDSLET
jgi:hypothetical protein